MSQREGESKDASDIQRLCFDALSLLNNSEFAGAVVRFERLEQELLQARMKGLQVSPSFLLLLHHNAAYCHQQY